MAQAEERQAFRNYYETNEEQWDEMERERMSMIVGKIWIKN